MDNQQWNDVEAYLEENEFENAGIAIARIIKESNPEITWHEITELTAAIEDEF